MNGDMIVNNEEGRLEPEEKYMVAKCDIDNIRSVFTNFRKTKANFPT